MPVIARLNIFVFERKVNGKYYVSVPDGEQEKGMTLRQLYLLAQGAKTAHRREVLRIKKDKGNGK